MSALSGTPLRHGERTDGAVVHRLRLRPVGDEPAPESPPPSGAQPRPRHPRQTSRPLTGGTSWKRACAQRDRPDLAVLRLKALGEIGCVPAPRTRPAPWTRNRRLYRCPAIVREVNAPPATPAYGSSEAGGAPSGDAACRRSGTRRSGWLGRPVMPRCRRSVTPPPSLAQPRRRAGQASGKAPAPRSTRRRETAVQTSVGRVSIRPPASTPGGGASWSGYAAAMIGAHDRA
jgi:hypothetical protein